MTVGTIVKQKEQRAVSISEDHDFHAISQALSLHNTGVCIVLDESGKLTGIVSERDLVRAYASHQGNVAGLRARDMMTSRVFICSPRDTEVDAMNYMLQKHIRHMPVVSDGKVLGVVSLADLVRFRLKRIHLLYEELQQEPDDEKRLGLFTRHLKDMRPQSG